MKDLSSLPCCDDVASRSKVDWLQALGLAQQWRDKQRSRLDRIEGKVATIIAGTIAVLGFVLDKFTGWAGSLSAILLMIPLGTLLMALKTAVYTEVSPMPLLALLSDERPDLDVAHLVRNYVDVAKANDPKVDRKAKFLDLSLWLLAIVIVAIVTLRVSVDANAMPLNKSLAPAAASSPWDWIGSATTTNVLYLFLLIAAIGTLVANLRSASASEKSAKASEASAEAARENAIASNHVAEETARLAVETADSIAISREAIAAEDRRHRETLRPLLILDASLVVTNQEQIAEPNHYRYAVALRGLLRNVGAGPAVAITLVLIPFAIVPRELSVPVAVGPNSITPLDLTFESEAFGWHKVGSPWPFKSVLGYSTIAFTTKAGTTTQSSNSGKTDDLKIDAITPTDNNAAEATSETSKP